MPSVNHGRHDGGGAGQTHAGQCYESKKRNAMSLTEEERFPE